MIYGRVIGNELRDIPPECLPVWGQRWAGYRTPQGPSPFSTRILNVDQMSEVGPALTSPAQFEKTLTEEEEGVETGSESSPIYSAFPLSPLTIRTDVTELTSQVETSSPLSVHPSSSYSHDSPEVARRSSRHSSPRNLRRPRITSRSRRQPERFAAQRHGAEPMSHLPVVHDTLLSQGGRRPFEHDYDPRDIDYASTSIQASISQGSHAPSGQLQFTNPPHSMAEWQFSDTYTQFPANPLQPNFSSRSSTDYPSRSLQAAGIHSMIPATPPAFTHSSAPPFAQHYFGIDPSWNHDTNVTLTSGTAYPRNLMIPQSPSVPLSQSFPGIQSPSTNSRVFYHSISDQYGSSSHPEDLLSAFPHPEGYTLLSLEKPEGDPFNG